MTTLAADAPRDYYQGDFHDYPVIATDIIYGGAAVGDNGSGYARPLVAGDPFMGFADYKADNATGAAGDVYVRCRTRGRAKLSISSLAITDKGKDVYASDDNTFTLTQGSNTRIGFVSSWVETGVGIIEFEATSGVQTELTDNSTGTAGDTIAASVGESTVAIPITLASITGAGDVLTNYTPGYKFKLLGASFAVAVPVTTAAKAATLNLEIGTTNVTGGEIALTSANCTPLGALVAGSAITAANTGSATDTISVEAASVTAFAEGSGYLLLNIQNMDTADAVASMAAKINTMTRRLGN